MAPDPACGVDDTPRRQRRFLGWTRDIAIAFVVFLVVAHWREKDLAQDFAPSFSAPLSTGVTVTLQQWLEQHPEKPVVLHFWASWCGVCSIMDGMMNSVARDWPVRGVALQSGDMAAVQAHNRKEKLGFESFIDNDGSIARALGVSAVPSTFIITPDGRIASASTGLLSAWGLRLQLWWTERNQPSRY